MKINTLVTIFIGFHLFFMVCPKYVTAQSYVSNISIYNTKDGLSSRAVTNFYQDKKGFIWICTKDGINRFDGKDFQTFTKDNSKLSYRSTWKTLEDTNGLLWIQSASSAVAKEWKDIVTKDLKIAKIDSIYGHLAPHSSSAIQFIYPGQQNHLYIYYDNGELYLFDGKFKQLKTPKEIIGESLKFIFANNNKYIFIGDHDIWESNIDGIITNHISTKSIIGRIKHNNKEKLLLPLFNPTDATLTFTLYQNKQLTPIDFDTKKIRSEFFANQIRRKKLHEIGLTASNNIYLFDRNNFYKFDLEGTLQEDFDPNIRQQIGKYNPNYLFSDSKGKLWTSTGDGIATIDHGISPFRRLLQNSHPISVRGIILFEDDQLIAATYNGIYAIDLNKNKHTRIHPFYNNWGATLNHKGQMVCGANAYLFTLDLKSNETVIAFPIKDHGEYGLLRKANETDAKLRLNIHFISPFVDSLRKTWVGSTQGLWVLDTIQNELKPYEALNPSFKSLFRSVVQHISAKHHKLLLCTSDGIYEVDTLKKECSHFESTVGISVLHSYQENDSIYWLASGSHGLIKWNKRNGQKIIFGKKEGLSNSNITAVYPDKQGFLWIPSYHGLMRFNLKTHNVESFYTTDGIAHNEYNRASHWHGKDGSFYFGGLNGITAFHPKDVSKFVEESIPLRIISYQELEGSSGQLIDKTQKIIAENNIVLESDIKSFIIKFALLNYNESERNKYAYKIEGLDKDWNPLNENSLRINQLPSGNYTLKIKGQDVRGVWSKEELNIPLKVIPPYYQRWGWQLLGIAIFGLLIYLFFRARFYYLEVERKKLERLVKERTKTILQQKEDMEVLQSTKNKLYTIIAHDLRDPVESFKGIVGKINFLVQKKEFNRVNQLAEYIENSADNLGNLLENLLGWANQQNGALSFRPSKHAFEKLIVEVFNTLQLFADNKNVEMVFDRDKEAFIFGDYHMLTTIIRNLVHNAIKYSHRNNQINIICKNENEITKVQIIDHGIGIPSKQLKDLFKIRATPSYPGTANEKGTGIGLLLCKELVLKHDGELQVSSKEHKGTTFTLLLPNLHC